MSATYKLRPNPESTLGPRRLDPETQHPKNPESSLLQAGSPKVLNSVWSLKNPQAEQEARYCCRNAGLPSKEGVIQITGAA